MNSFFQKQPHVRARIETALRRVGTTLGRLFLSKAGVTRLASGRFDALPRREMEAERLDRLRNPGDYIGK